MADIISKKTKEEKEAEDKLKKQKKTVVDIDVMDYLYSGVPLDDILKNDTLMENILSNGYYKAALCDSQGLVELNIKYKGTDYALTCILPARVPSIMALVKNETEVSAADVDLINDSQ